MDGPFHSDTVATPHAHELSPAEIEARMRWSRRQGYIAWYWPDVPIDAWRACLHEIERVTRALLLSDDTSQSAPVSLRVPPAASSRALGIAAFTAGMGPILGAWIEAGRLDADPDSRTLLLAHLEHGRIRARRMRDSARLALDLLAEAGAQPIVVKSMHTAVRFFDEPGLRPAADIDLVLLPSQIAVAQSKLNDAGYTLVKRRRTPHKSDWYPPDSPRALRTLDLTHSDNPFTLEIHGTLDREFYGVEVVRFDMISHLSIVPAPWLHPSARVLDQPLLTAYLAAHASEELHQLQLIRIVELILVMRRDAATGALDWRELAALLENRGAMRFVYPALSLAERLVPGAVDPWLLERAAGAATPRMRRVLSGLGPATAQRLDGLSLDERFLWVNGPLDYLRRLAHIFEPPGDGRSLMRYWLDRVLRVLRGRVSIRSGRANSSDERAGR